MSPINSDRPRPRGPGAPRLWERIWKTLHNKTGKQEEPTIEGQHVRERQHRQSEDEEQTGGDDRRVKSTEGQREHIKTKRALKTGSRGGGGRKAREGSRETQRARSFDDDEAA